jgi:hypothetical protein
MVYMGSGSVAVLKSIVSEADRFRSRPVRGKKYCRPLAVCYYAAGLVYLGTGASEPVQFLLDVLAVPPASKRFHGYRWAAARALIMTEFAESKLGWSYVGSW